MYLFQLNLLKVIGVIFVNLHSTMYLFQPIWQRKMMKQRHIYIPLCIYFNILPFAVCEYLTSFTFHYVSISTKEAIADCLAEANLHSTMYLFQLCLLSKPLQLQQFTFHYVSISTGFRLCLCPHNFLIYIPLCIYFNNTGWFNADLAIRIYIPLCIYFNSENMKKITSKIKFTFHYVSISTSLCITYT